MTVVPAELRAVPLLDGLDEATLRDLVVAGEEWLLADRDVVWSAGEAATRFFVHLDGALVTSLPDGTETGRHEAPGFLGAIALLGEERYAVHTRALGPARVLAVDGDAFRAILRRNPELEREILRLFGPVMRRINAMTQQREKLAALGTMAAGLAHELNNPAAAAERSAAKLADALKAISQTIGIFVESGIERAQAAELVALHREALARASRAEPQDRLEAADREDLLAGWLDAHGVPESWRLAEPLADAGLDEAWLDRVATAANAGDALPAAVQWAVASLTARGLVEDLRDSTARMSSLVRSVKEYSYLDQAPLQEIDVHHGLESTLTILGHKLRHGDVTVVRDYDDSLPPITAYAPELNQVWTNLLDNALDALDGHGTITLRTRCDGDQVLVEVHDDGPGIPPDVQRRVFDPFFTTKAPGAGTGLGLESAWRIVVERHRGTIALTSRAGDTRFIVRLPIAGPAA